MVYFVANITKAFVRRCYMEDIFQEKLCKRLQEKGGLKQ
jgi:hypothetical protein